MMAYKFREARNDAEVVMWLLGFPEAETKARAKWQIWAKQKAEANGSHPNKEINCKEQGMSLLDNSQGRKEATFTLSWLKENDCSLSPHFPFNFLTELIKPEKGKQLKRQDGTLHKHILLVELTHRAYHTPHISQHGSHHTHLTLESYQTTQMHSCQGPHLRIEKT